MQATVLSRKSPLPPARAASACAPPARVARHAGDPTARAREPREASNRHPRTSERLAGHTP